MDAAIAAATTRSTRMAEIGYITQRKRRKPQEADRAQGRAVAAASVAPYFLEDVRKELEARYGAKQLYENGLSIQTGLDVPLQEAANRAHGRGPAADRQTRGLPEAAPQRRRRGPCRRDVQASALGTADARRRHRARGRALGADRHDRSARGALRDRPIDTQGIRLDAEAPPTSWSAPAI